jgi:hypothetical protein
MNFPPKAAWTFGHLKKEPLPTPDVLQSRENGRIWVMSSGKWLVKPGYLAGSAGVLFRY